MSTNTNAITAWYTAGRKHVAFKNVGQDKRNLVAALERGEAVNVTFETSEFGRNRRIVTATLTGVVGHTFTSKPTTAFPQGKPVVVCSYAESAMEQAARQNAARKESKPAAAKHTTAPVAEPANLTDLAAAMRAAGFSAAEVLAALSATATAPVAKPTTAPVAEVAKPRSAKQLANDQRLREASAARRNGTAQPAKPTTAPVAEVPAPVAKPSTSRTCGICSGPMVRSYRRIDAPQSCCDDCMDRDANDPMVVAAKGAVTV